MSLKSVPSLKSKFFFTPALFILSKKVPQRSIIHLFFLQSKIKLEKVILFWEADPNGAEESDV